MRISLVAPSGSGKTTTAYLLQRALPGSVILSIAKPLADMQDVFYKHLGFNSPSISGSQDGEMLQKIRDIFLSRSPNFLIDEYKKRLSLVDKESIVINDDCRLGSYDELTKLGFIFVWVEGKCRVGYRDKFIAVNTDIKHDMLIPKSNCMYNIDNTGDLIDLITNVNILIKSIGIKK